MAHRPRYRRSEATLGMYYIRFIYSKFRLAFLDFIKQISILWPAGPHHQAYLNEYDAHSLYPLRLYFQYVFNTNGPAGSPGPLLLVGTGAGHEGLIQFY
jgi:hypothetical protein